MVTVYNLQVRVQIPRLWGLVMCTHWATLGRFFTPEDATSYAHNVCGFETSEHFRVRAEKRSSPWI